MVANEDIVRMSNPETSRAVISIKQTPRATSTHNQVVLDNIFGFDCILYEDVVSHRIVNNVAINCEVLDCVNRHCSVVRLMDCVALYK